MSLPARARSSTGRAPHLQRGCCGFKSHWVHYETDAPWEIRAAPVFVSRARPPASKGGSLRRYASDRRQRISPAGKFPSARKGRHGTPAGCFFHRRIKCPQHLIIATLP